MIWRENETALACGLAGEVVRAFGELRLRVSGTSMVPSILPGDLISIQKAELHEILDGEIVVYSRANRLVAHRVVAKASETQDGEAKLITRGDRCCCNDSPVSAGEFLGRVSTIQRGRASFVPSTRLNLWQRAIAHVFRSSDYATQAYLRVVARFRSDGESRLQHATGSAECQL